MKRAFLLLAIAFCIVGSFPAKANVLDVVRDSAGEIVDTTQTQAIEVCSAQKLKVPTIRELAEWAAAHGALGIRETAFPNTNPGENNAFDAEITKNRDEGYVAVWKNERQLGSTGVYFYYNPKGFKPVTAEEGYWSFRSASRIYLDVPAFYILNAGDGSIAWEDPVLKPVTHLAVRCSDQ